MQYEAIASFVIVPELDDTHDLSGGSPRLKDDHERRLAPASAGRQDWNNDLSKLILDINEAVEQAADRRTKSLILRRLRRALTDREEAS